MFLLNSADCEYVIGKAGIVSIVDRLSSVDITHMPRPLGCQSNAVQYDLATPSETPSTGQLANDVS